MLEIAAFWLLLSAVVAVAANTRGRSALVWFVLALIVSPLIAGLLVCALPPLRAAATDPHHHETAGGDTRFDHFPSWQRESHEEKVRRFTKRLIKDAPALALLALFIYLLSRCSH